MSTLSLGLEPGACDPNHVAQTRKNALPLALEMSTYYSLSSGQDGKTSHMRAKTAKFTTFRTNKDAELTLSQRALPVKNKKRSPTSYSELVNTDLRRSLGHRR